MRKMSDRGMLVDYSERCVKPNGDFDRIYYGHLAKDYDGPGASAVYDLVTDYAALSVGGRRPGHPRKIERHFFNKRIMTDEERQAGQARSQEAARVAAVQACSYAGGLATRDGGAGAGGAPEAEAGAGCAGSGDRDGEGEVA